MENPTPQPSRSRPVKPKLDPKIRAGKRYETTPLTQETLAQLLEAIASPLVRVALVLSFSCGLRVGEVVRLRKQDLNLPERTVRIVNGKGNKSRTVNYGPKAEAFLSAYLPSVEGELLFPTTAELLNKALKYAARKIGLRQRVSWHFARHGFALHNAKNGVPVVFISKLLGHSYVSTTDFYLAKLANSEAVAATRAIAF